MRCLTVCLLSLLFAGTASALDPELKIGYQLKVVMRVGDHPHFTANFRAELQRDLQGSLQAALGNLGTVEVVDLANLPIALWDPLWKTVDEKGLIALDNVNLVTAGKTHFLRIDFLDGRYELQARQHDGISGFVTPIIRKSQTHDRAFVARLAGLMIGQDFGIVGTFDGVARDKTILRFKAGELGAVGKWVKKDDIFAVIQIRNAPRKPRTPAKDPKEPKQPIAKEPTNPDKIGVRVDGVLMQVVNEPKDGICQCRMLFRYEDPLPVRGVLGYRCVKLGTIQAPLKLQLVDTAGLPQKAVLQVIARNDDFPDAPIDREQAVNKDGIFISKERFNNVAFVRVLMGNRRVARIPIEILDDRVDVRAIRIEPGAEVKDRLDQVRRDILGRITDGRLVQIRCFQDISALEQAGKNQAALDRGQSALKSLEAISAELQEDIERLQARLQKDLPNGGIQTNDCEQQLQTLRQKQGELKEHLQVLQVAIKEENDPSIQAWKKKMQEIVNRAELLVKQAEYDKALAAYEEALATAKDNAAAREKIEIPYQALKKAWALHDGDAQHAESRKWIYEIWPTLGKFRDLRDLLPAARQAFEKCKAVGDRLTIVKMQLAGLEVLNKFEAEVNMALAGSNAMEEEDKKGLEAMLKVKNDLEKLLNDVENYLAPGKPKK